jgi:4-alpha-glucanotransferase
MRKTHLVLGTYNHLPEGTEESVLEETYQTCYRPFLSVLYRFPDIYCSIHYSGSLLRWLEGRHPEFLMLLAEMTLRKQIELLGGGFFGPLLPLLSNSDRLGQIECLTTFIRKNFGKRPHGCWMTEYMWEPSLASTLQTSGMDFTFLPVSHFRAAGLGTESLFAPVLTEDQGRGLAVYPVFDCQTSFQQSLGFAEALESIRSVYELDHPLTVIFMAGEAIKELWSRSEYESPDVYLEKAFTAIRKDALSVETVTPARYLRSMRHFRRTYFPSGSTERYLSSGLSVKLQMERKKAIQCLNGEAERFLALEGIRQPLLRYEEGTTLYAKMQYVHLLVGQLRGDKSRKKTAQEELWRGECGDAYWYSPGGGIYRLPLREAAYSALIAAEKTTRQKNTFVSGIIQADIDFDGVKEILYQGTDINVYVHARGAVLFELDSLRTSRNLANVFRRYEELNTTGCLGPRRRCFLDRFHVKPSNLDDMSNAVTEDLGTFADAFFTTRELKRTNQEICFLREGFVSIGERKIPVTVEKVFLFRKTGVTVRYAITNRGSDTLKCHYNCDLNLSPSKKPQKLALTAALKDRSVELDSQVPDEMAESHKLTLVDLESEEPFSVATDLPCRILQTPLYNLVNIGGTLERLYQGCAITLEWPLDLAPEATWKASVSLGVRE